MKNKGIKAEKVKLNFGPMIKFPVTIESEQWDFKYNIGSGKFTASPRKGWNAHLGFKSFLFRLHTTHVYPQNGGARFLWVFLADTMAITLIFWAISGIFMWFQMKNVRFWGTVSIIGSVLIFSLVLFIMYQFYHAV